MRCLTRHSKLRRHSGMRSGVVSERMRVGMTKMKMKRLLGVTMRKRLQ
jgi:hypothetical protein